MPTQQFGLIGVDELVKKLDSVSRDLRLKGGRFALRKAANLVANKARENAAKIDDKNSARSIEQNIAVRWNGRLFNRTGSLGFRVGIRGGARVDVKGNPDQGSGSPTPHWRFVEFGTSNMPAQPFFRRALEENISAATGEFIDNYSKSIDRAIRRAK